jgi:hypothetical protein
MEGSGSSPSLGLRWATEGRAWAARSCREPLPPRADCPRHRVTNRQDARALPCTAVLLSYHMWPGTSPSSTIEGGDRWRSSWHARRAERSSGPGIGTRADGRSARRAAGRSRYRSCPRRRRSGRPLPHRPVDGRWRRRTWRGSGPRPTTVRKNTSRRPSDRAGRSGRTSSRRDCVSFAGRGRSGAALDVGEALHVIRGTTRRPGPFLQPRDMHLGRW